MVWLSYAPSLVLFLHTSCHSYPATTPVMRAESLIPLQPYVHKASFWHTKFSITSLLWWIPNKGDLHLITLYDQQLARMCSTYAHTGALTKTLWLYTRKFHSSWVSKPCKSDCDLAMAQAVSHKVITLQTQV